MIRPPFIKLRNIVIPGACLGIMAYFAYHAVHGDHGLYASWRLADEVAALRAARDELAGHRQELERKVALLRPERLDPDMLDERARATLNLAHPDELIIYRYPER